MPKEMTIMIVDDDEDDRELFFDAVKTIDPSIKCLSARNGQEALELLNSAGLQLPQYIFLDLNMPRVDGKQCLISLKKNPRLASIPVIIYSTSTRPEDISETLKLGAIQFITKPTLYSDICKRIASAIRR